MEYYVYIYLDPTKPGNYVYGDYIFNYEPFYVGKGKGNRLFNHIRPHYRLRKCEKSYIINSIYEKGFKPIIFKIKDNMSSEDAYKLEGVLLETIGLKNKNKGPLSNVMAYANGLHCHSEETKKIISMTSSTRRHTEETKEKIRQSKIGPKNPMYKNGKTKHPILRLSKSEAKLGPRNPMYGKKLTQEQLLKRSLESNRKKTYKIIHPDGKIEIIIGILRYCGENKLNCRGVRRVIYGERKKYKGMIIKEIK